MFYVVAYDIRDDRRRTRVAKILEDFGDRAQYSVFEMELDRPERIKALHRRLETPSNHPRMGSARIFSAGIAAKRPPFSAKARFIATMTYTSSEGSC